MKFCDYFYNIIKRFYFSFFYLPLPRGKDKKERQNIQRKPILVHLHNWLLVEIVLFIKSWYFIKWQCIRLKSDRFLIFQSLSILVRLNNQCNSPANRWHYCDFGSGGRNKESGLNLGTYWIRLTKTHRNWIMLKTKTKMYRILHKQLSMHSFSCIRSISLKVYFQSNI